MSGLGLKIALPAAYTDNTLPVLHDDALLTTGSLLLIDPAHSSNPLLTVPTPGSPSVPNIAWKECAACIGSGTQSTLASAFVFDVSYVANTDGKLELTTKGGLHGIVSITTQNASNHGFRIASAALLNTYIAANPSHTFFLSQEIYATRVVTPTGNATIARIHDTASLPRFLHSFAFGGSNVNNNVANTLSGQIRVPASLNAMGSQIRDGAANTWQSAAPVGATTQVTAEWGRTGSENAAFSNVFPSYILYRQYLEDLTVSGRSWATVDALIVARNQADVLTSGGRYFGDTYTNPSVIA